MKLNLKSDLKFHRFAIYFFFQIETLTCATSTTRYYKWYYKGLTGVPRNYENRIFFLIIIMTLRN